MAQQWVPSTLPLLNPGGGSLGQTSKGQSSPRWGFCWPAPLTPRFSSSRDLRGPGSPSCSLQLQRAISSTATSCSEIFPLAGPSTPSFLSSFICLFRAKKCITVSGSGAGGVPALQGGMGGSGTSWVTPDLSLCPSCSLLPSPTGAWQARSHGPGSLLATLALRFLPALFPYRLCRKAG